MNGSDGLAGNALVLRHLRTELALYSTAEGLLATCAPESASLATLKCNVIGAEIGWDSAACILPVAGSGQRRLSFIHHIRRSHGYWIPRTRALVYLS